MKSNPPDTSDSRWWRLRWWILGALLLAAVGAGWYSIFGSRTTVTLTDGSVIVCEGVFEGRKLSDTDFEEDIYAYPNSLFQPAANRFREALARLNPFNNDRIMKSESFIPAPWLVVGRASNRNWSDIRLSFLRDGGSYSWQDGKFPRIINSGQLPAAEKKWVFEFQENAGEGGAVRNLGEMVISNPGWKPKPAFAGKPCPLECSTPDGVVRLVSAKFVKTEARNPDWANGVVMAFDASGCPDLLPCQVIGVRITDSWGSTIFRNNDVVCEGGLIHAKCSLGSAGGLGFHSQSPDWRVKIAICRGGGARFAPGEIAVFDHLSGTHPAPATRRAGGRELELLSALVSTDPRGVESRFDWRLDQAGPVLFPIITRIVKRLADGSVDENPALPTAWQSHVRRKRLVLGPYMDADPVLTTDIRFESRFQIPPGIAEFDLHVVLEKPRVFAFDVRIADWPAVEKRIPDR